MKPALPTEAECQQIYRALGDVDVERITVTVRENSPWLSVDAWIHMEGERHIAIWRSTGHVYRVHEGRVEDDPFVAGW